MALRVAFSLSVAVYALAFFVGWQASSPEFFELLDLRQVRLEELLANNFRVVLLLMAGMLSLGLLTFWGLAVQGFTHGAILADSALPLHSKLLHLWPHGLLELPALILAAAFGFYPWLSLLMREPVRAEVLLYLALVSIFLLLVAGLLEKGVWG